jgi:hypothetical protein
MVLVFEQLVRRDAERPHRALESGLPAARRGRSQASTIFSASSTTDRIDILGHWAKVLHSPRERAEPAFSRTLSGAGRATPCEGDVADRYLLRAPNSKILARDEPCEGFPTANRKETQDQNRKNSIVKSITCIGQEVKQTHM